MIAALELAFLMTISAIIAREDFRAFRIPDLANLLLLTVGLLVRMPQGWPAMSFSLLSGGIVFACVLALRSGLTKLRGRGALGMGDVKLMGACAVWLDAPDIPSFVLVACCSALVFVAVALRNSGGTLMARRIPFGPFLCLGLLLTWATENLQLLDFG